MESHWPATEAQAVKPLTMLSHYLYSLHLQFLLGASCCLLSSELGSRIGGEESIRRGRTLPLRLAKYSPEFVREVRFFLCTIRAQRCARMSSFYT